MTPERTVRWLGGCLALLAVNSLAMWFWGPRGPHDLPARYDSPMLALEMAADTAEVSMVAGKSGDCWLLAMKRAVWLDLPFLFLHGAVLALLAALLRCRSRYRLLGRWAAVAAIASIAFDLGENAGLLATLQQGVHLSWLRYATLGKFASVAVAAWTLAPLFVRALPLATRAQLYGLLAAGLYATGGVTLLWAVLFGGPRHDTIESGTALIAAAHLTVLCAGLSPGNRSEFLRSL